MTKDEFIALCNCNPIRFTKTRIKLHIQGASSEPAGFFIDAPGYDVHMAELPFPMVDLVVHRQVMLSSLEDTTPRLMKRGWIVSEKHTGRSVARHQINATREEATMAAVDRVHKLWNKMTENLLLCRASTDYDTPPRFTI